MKFESFEQPNVLLTVRLVLSLVYSYIALRQLKNNNYMLNPACSSGTGGGKYMSLKSININYTYEIIS
jgi:hypothetical protein